MNEEEEQLDYSNSPIADLPATCMPQEEGANEQGANEQGANEQGANEQGANEQGDRGADEHEEGELLPPSHEPPEHQTPASHASLSTLDPRERVRPGPASATRKGLPERERGVWCARAPVFSIKNMTSVSYGWTGRSSSETARRRVCVHTTAHHTFRRPTRHPHVPPIVQY